MTSLAALLFAVGLRLSPGEMLKSLRGRRMGIIFLANFTVVPALALLVARLFGVRPGTTAGMLLLAAAPFAPVVPIFSQFARGDLALAGATTALFPFFSAFLTPWICELGLRTLSAGNSLKFNALANLAALASSISLPLLAGAGAHELWPAMGRRLVGPLEFVSRAAGAVSLGFVVLVEREAILATGWKALLAMAIVSEASLGLGYLLGGPDPSARRVIAFGTSNRNIALALLIVVQSFPNTPAMAALVANGLLLIVLGLAHVACWRWLGASIEKG